MLGRLPNSITCVQHLHHHAFLDLLLYCYSSCLGWSVILLTLSHKLTRVVTSTPIDSTSHSVVERSPDASSTKSQLRVLCVGASIVWGYGSTDENGFRQGLRSALVGAGHDVDMIGSRQHGSMSDNDVEAWPGFRIEEVAAKFGQDVPGKPQI